MAGLLKKRRSVDRFSAEEIHDISGRRPKMEKLTGKISETGSVEFNWEDDKHTGQGIYIDLGGGNYIGQFMDGRLQGEGVFTWPDGSRYEGEWEDGLPNGWGIMTLPNGNSFEGDWENGGIGQQGTLMSPDGSRYTGQWNDGCKNGRGIDELGVCRKPGNGREGLFQCGLR